MDGERRPGHRGRLGEFLKLPPTAGIAVHQPESGSDPLITNRAEQTGRQGAGRLEVGTQDLDEHELGELRQGKTDAREFRCPFAEKLVEKPLQDRRLRRSGPNMDQRRQDVRQKPPARRVQPNMAPDQNAVIAVAKLRELAGVAGDKLAASTGTAAKSPARTKERCAERRHTSPASMRTGAF